MVSVSQCSGSHAWVSPGGCKVTAAGSRQGGYCMNSTVLAACLCYRRAGDLRSEQGRAAVDACHARYCEALQVSQGVLEAASS